MLTPKIPALLEIRDAYDVAFYLEVVPIVCNGEAPAIYVGREVAEFCCLTGAEIDVDLYVYNSGDTDSPRE